LSGGLDEVLLLARDNEVCQRLMTIPGVGPVVSLAFISTVDVPARFRNSKAVGPSLGLTPVLNQSGESHRVGRISLCGDEAMRALLYEAAQVMLTRVQKWSWLKAWAMNIAKRRGQKKAIVALARRLAVIMHRMWSHATRPDERRRETRPGNDLARSRPNDLRSLRRSGALQRPRVPHDHRALSADRQERRHEHGSCYARTRDERGQVWALSSPGGYIHIDWSVEKDELLPTWKEHGGPPLDGPAEHEGFGNLLVGVVTLLKEEHENSASRIFIKRPRLPRATCS
jgi:hypothetical protein